ncbi:transglutaminase domain-containing protein [Butyrivibrio sp. INlla16]|uniref:transglutaminase domain-containing protein n=1 Tax=Butyrivibrio sp. INlla16 TaxID=1520807 RepID=UPI00088E9714|nr:transglutaminase domain-containing protein [Butyrivibrio sp. INlla16]SDB29430.1 Transglutaminase-like superfamily protein [Butyrivibrio sp. INlla16]
MKKRIITGILTAVLAFTMAVYAGEIKAEAKTANWSEYAPSSCICTSDFVNIKCTSKRHNLADTRAKIDSILQVIKPIVDAAPEAPHEAVKYFHDEICQMTTYKLDTSYDIATPYGVFVNKQAKCVGYASAFKALCDITGIPCYEVSGKINSGYHAWNIVQLEDGQWYEVDCTFDDTYSSKEISYKWFLITTEQMGADHTRSSITMPDSSIYNPNEGVPIAYGTLYAHKKSEEEQLEEYDRRVVRVEGAEYWIHASSKTCEFQEFPKNTTSYTIPDTINYKGFELTVDTINIDASIRSPKLKSVTIGKNIKKIDKDSFSGCKNLKKVTIKSTILSSVGKNAFKGISSKAVVKAPKNKLKIYKKILGKKSGIPKSTKYKKL